MCAPSAPPPPDYAGAAKAQGAANLDAAIAEGILNRPNEVGPLGSRTWNQTGTYRVGDRDVPIFTGTTALTPQGQRLHDTNVSTQQELGTLGLDAAKRVGGILGQQFNIGQIPGIEDTKFDRNSVRDALLARTDQDYARDRDAAESELIARGHARGSKGWEQEMQRLDRARTDARQRTDIAVGQMQQQELDARRQMIQEALLDRQTPLNEISALRSGSQVQQPNFQPYAANANVAAAPMFAATQAQGAYDQNAYNQQVAQRNAMMGGLFQLGAAGVGAYPWGG